LLRSQAKDIINIHLAADFHLSYVNIQAALSDPRKYTINGHQYLMVELPDFLSIPLIENALVQLLNGRFIPIITHPERNRSLQSHVGELQSWVGQGILIQITAQSLLGRFGATAKRCSEKLLKAKLVHFVASDAHDCVDRPPDLGKAYDYVAGLRSRSEADALFIHNPAATLTGEPLPEIQEQPRKRFRLFRKS
jgi:protein-tyrosine phosphatase